jgi:hypothetical protein
MGIKNFACSARFKWSLPMTSHIRSIAVLLMIGAALAATPVLAADAVAGNHGPAEKPANRDAIVSLPAATPMPTPKVDAGALSRGFFDQDAATALDGLATLSVSSDGTTSETPASGDLRDAFNEAVKGHQK